LIKKPIGDNIKFLAFILDGIVKSPRAVIPAKAGVHKFLESLDPGLRQGDDLGQILTFYDAIILDDWVNGYLSEV